MSRDKKEIGPLTTRECLDMIKGSLTAVIEDRKYFYHSTTGPNYSHLTDEGEELLIKSMNTLLPLLADAKHRDINERAKQITLDSLKEDYDR
jgi:hypothetical protein